MLADLLPGHDAVVNFAAESHVDRSITGSRPFLLTNVVGANTLFEAAMRSEIPRFLHISTDETYGSISEPGSFREDDKLEPNSPYSASKASADLLARAYAETYGYPITITRTTNNFGPYQFPEKAIPLFTTNLLDGQKIPLYGDGLNERDWLFVDDHCAAVHLVLQQGAVGEVADPDRAARHLVLVRGPDAAARGADRPIALGGLPRLVDRGVMRQDERARFADLEPRRHVDARGLEHVDFLEQRGRREHDAIADVAGDLVAQDARRYEVEHRLAPADDQRVAGIVTALEANDTLRMIGQPVDDLAFAFVTPLGADDDYVLCHTFTFVWARLDVSAPRIFRAPRDLRGGQAGGHTEVLRARRSGPAAGRQPACRARAGRRCVSAALRPAVRRGRARTSSAPPSH